MAKNQCLGIGTNWMMLCSHLDHPVCGMSSYIVTPFHPVRRYFETWANSIEYKVVDFTRTNKTGVHTGTRCPLLCPSTRPRPCTQVSASCPNSSEDTWDKGVFTLVLGKYSTRARCPGTKCERCLRVRVWLCAHLVPGNGAQVRLSLGANANTHFL